MGQIKALALFPFPAGLQVPLLPHLSRGCSSSLELLISQLCPSKLSWLSAQFISSTHSGAKYLYYYCNYFPTSITQG